MIRALTLLCLVAGQVQVAPSPPTPQASSRAQAIAEFAETLIAARAEDRARLLAENPSLVTTALRYLIAARASQAAFAKRFRAALELYQTALDVARAAGDRGGESDTLQELGNSHYFLHEFGAVEAAVAQHDPVHGRDRRVDCRSRNGRVLTRRLHACAGVLSRGADDLPGDQE